MAILVSPGVSVTVTDESFYIPAASPTVPLIFIATADEKTRPDGVTPAEGTYEHDVIRTVTSITQSVNLYGIPRFIKNAQGQPQHGDCRNEYGLFALNQFLGVGNRAYVIRANVNLDDNRENIMAMWDRSIETASLILEQLIAARIQEYNDTNHPTTGTIVSLQNLVGGSGYTNGVYSNVSLSGGSGSGAIARITVVGGIVVNVELVNGGTGYTVGDVLTATTGIGVGTGFQIEVAAAGTKTTVTKSELLSDLSQAMDYVYDKYSFRNLKTLFEADYSSQTCPDTGGAGICVYPNGFGSPATQEFLGVIGLANRWVTNDEGTVVSDEWTAAEASSFLQDAAEQFKYTVEFLDATSLGANDAARRLAIVQALQASINSNQDIRSEQYEYNLVLAPGYHEVVDELLALVMDINEEALVIADTPMNMDPDKMVQDWANVTTSTRQRSNNVAYYYPHGLASNLDGSDVVIAASGIALRTFAYSDTVSHLWFAPAGTQRGVVTGVSQVGYVKGTLGTATQFVPVALTNGQRDNMYQYFTNINPIANLPGRGILIFGQKSSQNSASAMDRVNVSRLIKYIKRQIRKNLVPFLFEPNDQVTRNNVKATVEGFLQDIMVKRGLYDFVVLCDESNNTPDRIDRNELYVDIALKPTKAIEFIYVPIRIVATGAQI